MPKHCDQSSKIAGGSIIFNTRLNYQNIFLNVTRISTSRDIFTQVSFRQMPSLWVHRLHKVQRNYQWMILPSLPLPWPTPLPGSLLRLWEQVCCFSLPPFFRAEFSTQAGARSWLFRYLWCTESLHCVRHAKVRATWELTEGLEHTLDMVFPLIIRTTYQEGTFYWHSHHRWGNGLK